MTRFAFPFFLLLAMSLTGCLFESAPTNPSRSNNTWLLGVWEYTDTEGAIRKATLTPSNSDRMQIFYEEFNSAGKKIRSGTYSGWVSRVGQASLLTVELKEGATTGYLVVGFQFLDPLSVRMREVTAEETAKTASPFQLRAAIRQAFKEGTIFQGRNEIWTKTGEIYWDPEGDPEQHTFAPPRNLPISLVAEEELTAP